MTLRVEGERVLSIERNVTHGRNPFLDKLEIMAEAIAGLLEEKSSFSQGELRTLAHIRQMTRMRKTKPGRAITAVNQPVTNGVSKKQGKGKASPETFRKKKSKNSPM